MDGDGEMVSKGATLGDMAEETRRETLTDRLVDTAFVLIEKKGWLCLDLLDIACVAGVSLEDVYRVFEDKGSILVEFHRRVDRGVLGYGVLDVGEFEGVRDRIFEVLMRRFEVLVPYRGGILVLLEDCVEDCLIFLGSGLQLMNSMDWMLRLALVRRRILVPVMCGIFLSVLRVWVCDESEDMGGTMVALDRDLGRVDFLFSGLV